MLGLFLFFFCKNLPAVKVQHIPPVCLLFPDNQNHRIEAFSLPSIQYSFKSTLFVHKTNTKPRTVHPIIDKNHKNSEDCVRTTKTLVSYYNCSDYKVLLNLHICHNFFAYMYIDGKHTKEE